MYRLTKKFQGKTSRNKMHVFLISFILSLHNSSIYFPYSFILPHCIFTLLLQFIVFQWTLSEFLGACLFPRGLYSTVPSNISNTNSPKIHSYLRVVRNSWIFLHTANEFRNTLYRLLFLFVYSLQCN